MYKESHGPEEAIFEFISSRISVKKVGGPCPKIWYKLGGKSITKTITEA